MPLDTVTVNLNPQPVGQADREVAGQQGDQSLTLRALMIRWYLSSVFVDKHRNSVSLLAGDLMVSLAHELRIKID